LQTKILNNYFLKYLLTIFSIVGGYCGLIALDNFTNHQHNTLCFFKLVTSIPCPGCGMGRATLELINGNIAASFNYNILCVPFTIIIFISLIWLLIDVFQQKKTFFDFIERDLKSSYKFFLFALIIIDWTTNIIRQI
jgi:hypothetical protein